MGFKLETDHDRKIVTCIFEGDLTLESAKQGALSLNEKALEFGYVKLYDVTESVLSASTSDSYFMPRDMINLINDPEHTTIRVAILYSDPAQEQFWEFYKVTSQNAGYIIQVFTSRESAVEWLSKQ